MEQSKKLEKVIRIVSIAIPIAVAVILGIRQKVYLGEWTKMLPHGIGIINGLTAVFLIGAFLAIKSKNISLHKTLNTIAFSLGALFLLMYICYHISNPSTSSEQMQSTERYIYLFFLISHISLSIVVVRYVLLAMYFGLTRQYVQHKQITKVAFPLWLYVSVSGVIVYVMISPYYQ